MHSIHEKISYLLKAYSENTITPDQEQELFQLVSDGAVEKEVVEHIRNLVNQSTIPDHQVNWEALYLRILESRSQTAVVEMRRPVKTRWIAGAAAAILVIAAAIAVFRKLHSDVEKRNEQANALQKLSDSSQVVLTLSDGRRIILDSIVSDKINDAGAATVIHLGNGTLDYDAKNTADIDADVYNTIAVPRGKQYQLLLPDGTHVWLNAASTLRYPLAFRGNTREVFLSGEAYFSVKASAAKPFFVNTPDVKVQALGTSFNVMAYSDENVTAATLFDGSVKVKAADSAMIKPGEMASVISGGPVKTTVADTALVASWRYGEFKFDGLIIEDIMRQLTRWYNIEVSYNAGRSHSRFYGLFPRNWEVSEILDALELTGNVKFEIKNQKILVLPGRSG